jgi:glycosyltransferase involved in cell wall biosynthesis
MVLMNVFKAQALRTLYRKGRSLTKLPPLRRVIYDVNSAGKSSRKRALLAYLLEPFRLDESNSRFLTHQNLKRCKQMAQVVGELGFTVDAVLGRYLPLFRQGTYDLIVSDKSYLKGIDGFTKRGTIKLFFPTSMNYALHNVNLRRRHEMLFERRRCALEIRRTYGEIMPYVAQANALAGIGNDFTMSTWRDRYAGPIYPINNHGFSGTRFIYEGKSHLDARLHFLFFASRSQIQKGLDLLLEVFPKHPHLHLHVCSQFEQERDFCALYHKELFRTPNIDPVGWIAVNSPRYNDLMKRCAYVIHPTCSEGQAGSVVQCMHSGLIPLVTKWAGIETGDFGVTLEETVEDIERVVCYLSQLPAEWHRERSIRARQIAEARYSEEAFIKRWRHVLTETLDNATVINAGGVAANHK